MYSLGTVLVPSFPSTLLPPGGDLPGAIYGCCNLGALRKPAYNLQLARRRCHALHQPSSQGYSMGSNTSLVTKRPEAEVSKLEDINHTGKMINDVKAMLSSMGEGEISISAYDTAWVALVEDIHGKGGPQFPSSLQWIVDNQLPDGSWGDSCIFTIHDRLINTLACVIALTSWSTSPECCKKGTLFLKENMWRLAEEDVDLMMIGFEVAFPSLIEIAKGMNLELPYDDPALNDIYAKRRLKLQRIPKDLMHEVPTTLLYSLEGMLGLDWKRLLRLQCNDGSFLFSPSSTAFALMQTSDGKCMKYLEKIVERFNGGVPNVYPVDLFERLWVVDRLERLGISRYFEAEIKECIQYAYRYWTEDGICWARNSRITDTDDTCMGFRLLRLHGYNVSSDVFSQFERDGEFFCCAGQSNQAITGMFNLNRASQVLLPGESILEKAKKFSYGFLREKQASNQLTDKWIIAKDLPGEVEYALNFPFYASLPRIEERFYVEQYGGGNDVWIGKVLYRMLYVNNDIYLELAKSDFNQCQALHQQEWMGIQKWYTECGLEEKGVSRNSMLRSYFLATASIFEPERMAERLGWARTAILMEAVDACTEEMRGAFIFDFLNNTHTNSNNGPTRWVKSEGQGLLRVVKQTLDSIALDASPAGNHKQNQVLYQLRHAWEGWLLTWRKEEETNIEGPSLERELLLVRTIELCAGRYSSDHELMSLPEYARLAQLTSSICHQLRRCMSLCPVNGENNTSITSSLACQSVEPTMQKLVECVLQSSNDLNHQTKKTFLTIAKSFYYAAHCPPATLNSHINMVLFERVA